MSVRERERERERGGGEREEEERGVKEKGQEMEIGRIAQLAGGLRT